MLFLLIALITFLGTSSQAGDPSLRKLSKTNEVLSKLLKELSVGQDERPTLIRQDSVDNLFDYQLQSYSDTHCSNGILGTSLDGVQVCCGSNCGVCGGKGCVHRDGGVSQCCTRSIVDSGVFCSSSTDVACIMPECSLVALTKDECNGLPKDTDDQSWYFVNYYNGAIFDASNFPKCTNSWKNSVSNIGRICQSDESDVNNCVGYYDYYEYPDEYGNENSWADLFKLECKTAEVQVADEPDVCENNDERVVELDPGFNFKNCISTYRWADRNYMTCDNMFENLVKWGMMQVREGETLRTVCCQTCKNAEDICTLDKDSYEVGEGDCREGEKSFQFCGLKQCISNPTCTEAKFGLNDPICPCPDGDITSQCKCQGAVRTSGSCNGGTYTPSGPERAVGGPKRAARGPKRATERVVGGPKRSSGWPRFG